MSFCRITGKSRGLPKPNYFPLLPPISPADAKRLCRITNKSQGLPSHHYIPVLSSATSARAHCKVTAKAEGQGPHRYPNADGLVKLHSFAPEYKYVYPRFDEDQKHQKALLALMASKTGAEESSVRYVYCVEEKKTNLVIPAGLEAAVRDGEVHNVMLGQEGDTILIKMYQGPNLTVDVDNFVASENLVLMEGMGPSEAVLIRQLKEEEEKEKRKLLRVQAIRERTKVFEEKEKLGDLEELMMTGVNGKAKRKTMKKENSRENNLTFMKEKLLSGENGNEPVFGHIVQSPSFVEFYPGTSVIDLPEGKIVPGRMERHNNTIKFVPGMMLEGKFVPGQIVITNKGEEFVPGQVLETSEGPKFIPGQFVDTVSGPKFVPGQTMLTDGGYQFVPGQIIETKAGPTFIPGQIIMTGNEAKFVPGRVIETADGPRFVPGRVLEIGDQVTFVSGQVVDTPEGLRYVAPDLESDINGFVQEFSVQGFEVTPEELKLLRPAPLHTTSDTVSAIDSEILKQLSEAGMSIGRQMSSGLPKVDVRLLPVTSERLKFAGEHAVKMMQVVASLAEIAIKVNKIDDSCTSFVPMKDAGVEVLRDIEQNQNLERYLRVLVASAVVECRQKDSLTEDAFMTALSLAIESSLGEAVLEVSPENVVDIIFNFLSSPKNFNQIVIETTNYLEANESLSDKIKFAMSNSSTSEEIIKKISPSLYSTMSEAFTEFFSKEPTLLAEVFDRMKDVEKSCSDESCLKESLQDVIVSVVKEKSKKKLEELIRERQTKGPAGIEEFQNLLLQCAALAKALGMTTVVATLQEVISDPSTHEILCSDDTVMAILQRLTVMRQMAEIKPEFAEALKKLTSDPESAKCDPRMRELLRRSTALTVIPRDNLQSAADIPLSLLLSSNSLALEDHFATTNHPRILLILKSGVQAVVPREAARAVLTGQVPYAVVDEKGIKYFKPLHVFSAMKMPKYAARCFTMYSCPEINDHERNLSNDFSAGRTTDATESKLKLKGFDVSR